MCGTIKYEGTNHKIGNIKPNDDISIMIDNKVITTKWLGHIREESGPPKLEHKSVALLIREYTERGIPFSVPSGYNVDAYLIYSKNYPGGKGIFIKTRSATATELTQCKHPRHPKFRKDEENG